MIVFLRNDLRYSIFCLYGWCIGRADQLSNWWCRKENSVKFKIQNISWQYFWSLCPSWLLISYPHTCIYLHKSWRYQLQLRFLRKAYFFYLRMELSGRYLLCSHFINNNWFWWFNTEKSTAWISSISYKKWISLPLWTH